MDTTINAGVRRTVGLRQMLTNRRREMQADVDVDLRDVGIEEELSFALRQRRTKAVARVDAALERLEAGRYGACFACNAEITEGRLRALPFAVRCTACEERREREGRGRRDLRRQGYTTLFPESQGA